MQDRFGQARITIAEIRAKRSTEAGNYHSAKCRRIRPHHREWIFLSFPFWTSSSWNLSRQMKSRRQSDPIQSGGKVPRRKDREHTNAHRELRFLTGDGDDDDVCCCRRSRWGVHGREGTRSDFSGLCEACPREKERDSCDLMNSPLQATATSGDPRTCHRERFTASWSLDFVADPWARVHNLSITFTFSPSPIPALLLPRIASLLSSHRSDILLSSLDTTVLVEHVEQRNLRRYFCRGCIYPG